MSKVKVLLTGGAGFIGSHCLEHWLATTDWHVTVADSLRHRGRVERVRPSAEASPDRVRLVKIDLANDRDPAWDSVHVGGPYDVVVNMASESHVDRSITDPVGTWRNNCALALNVLEYARHAGCEAFVQISTDEVFGPAAAGRQHGEWSPIVPSNPYAASKAAQEALAVSYWRTFSVPLILTNTMNNFGERQDAEKFIPKIIRHLKAGEEVPVHGAPGDPGSRFYLHAKNHADAVRHLIERTVITRYPHGELPSRYNVVGDTEVTNDEMVALVAGVLGVPARMRFVDFHSTRPGHDKRYALDGAKLKASGWEAPFSFHRSLRQTVLWYDRHPEALKDYRPEAA